MSKCDFDKVALLKLHYGMGVLLNIFRTPFPKNNSEGCFWRRTQCVLEKAALRKKSQKVIGGKLKVCLSFRKLNLGEILALCLVFNVLENKNVDNTIVIRKR